DRCLHTATELANPGMRAIKGLHRSSGYLPGRHHMQRKTRSKTISAALLAGALALSLTGCQQDAGADDKTLSVWLPPFAAEGAEQGDLELWQEIVAPFAEENDVQVDI